MDEKDLLSLLATGIILWFEQGEKKNNFGQIPRQLKRGINLLSVSTKFKGTLTHRGDFVTVFSKPIGEWFDLRNDMEGISDGVLIIDGVPSDLCYEWCVEGIDTEGELQQRHILEIMQCCGGEGQRDYVEIRRFIIEHPIIHAEELEAFIKSKSQFNQDLRKTYSLLNIFYEPLPFYSIQNRRIEVCKHCGWTITSRGGKKKCISEKCRALGGLEKSIWMDVTPDLRRLTRGAMRYIALPGRPELSLQKKLEKLGVQIKLWPKLDLYDLEIEFSDTKWAVDVKDYSNPYNLIHKVTHFDLTECSKQYVVVPKERGKLFKGYKQILNRQEPADFRFLMEDELIKRVKEHLTDEKLRSL